MLDPQVEPSATDDVEVRADWLELLALSRKDNNSSLIDLSTAMQRGGTADELVVKVEDDHADLETDPQEQAQIAAGDALLEVEDRKEACGGEGGVYPFEVGDQFIRIRGAPERSPYIFMLLLSAYGHDVGPQGLDGASLFEKLSAYAGGSYFGSPDPRLGSYVFGFPRRLAPAGFRAALDNLCTVIGEGGRSRGRPQRKDQKDAGLDVVAYRLFADQRPGSKIGFGQCATGANWRDKLTDLQPEAWCRLWMAEPPAVTPLRLFFVPHRIPRPMWQYSAIQAGIVFDRCRVAEHARNLPRDLANECREWSRYVLRERVRA